MSDRGGPKSVLVDANFLVANVNPKLHEDDRARIDHFLADAEKTKTRIIIPMPAVAEYLVRSDIAAIETFQVLERKSFVVLAPFDRAAAFECAQLDRAALGGSNDKKDGVLAPWQKIKIDRQIVATGKAHGATLVISADDGVRSNALRVGMRAMTIQDLPLPDSAKQGKLNFSDKSRGKQKDQPR